MSEANFRSCLKACVRCAQACELCAEACLNEDNMVMMADCIRTDRDCAQLCWTASALMVRNSHFVGDLCALCAKVCDVCAEECEKHDQEHCQHCAEACRECANECHKLDVATL